MSSRTLEALLNIISAFCSFVLVRRVPNTEFWVWNLLVFGLCGVLPSHPTNLL